MKTDVASLIDRALTLRSPTWCLAVWNLDETITVARQPPSVRRIRPIQQPRSAVVQSQITGVPAYLCTNC